LRWHGVTDNDTAGRLVGQLPGQEPSRGADDRIGDGVESASSLADRDEVFGSQMDYARHWQIGRVRGRGGTEPQAGSGADSHEISGGKTVGGGGCSGNRLAAELPRLGQAAQFIQAKKAAIVRITRLSGGSARFQRPGPIIAS